MAALDRWGAVVKGTEGTGKAVQDRRGSYGCDGIRFDMAAQVWTGKVIIGVVSSGWAGSVQRKGVDG